MEFSEQQLNVIDMGEKLEKIMASDVGVYLKARRDAEVQEVNDLLADVSPEDSKEISRLQVRLRVANEALNWITDGIHTGNNEIKAFVEVHNLEDDPEPEPEQG